VLADRIRTRLADDGVSQAWLARELGVKRSAVSQWVSGATSPNLDNLRHMADVFGLTDAELGAWVREAA